MSNQNQICSTTEAGDTNSCGFSVAINDKYLSEQFAVIGNSGTEILIRKGLYPKTLIMSLKNGSSSVMDNCGYVSMYKNILAIMRPYVIMQQFPLLQLFHLDKNAIPHLITEQRFLDNSKEEEAGFIQNALVQNGWLLIIKNFFEKNYVKLCLKSVEHMAD